MNTGRFRTRRNCCHSKSNYSLSDVENSGYYPCGQNPANREYLVKHYKDYTNRGLEHLPYLEKKSCIIRQRNGYRKKPNLQNNNLNTNELKMNNNLNRDNMCALMRLSNF
jgi:hypothetical protein